MRISRSASAALLVLLWTPAGQTQELRYTVAGHVTFATGVIAAEIPEGTAFSGTFLFDTSIPDTDPNPDTGRYGGAFPASFVFGDYEVTSNSVSIVVADRVGDFGPRDAYLFNFNPPSGARLAGQLPSYLAFVLSDTSGSVFESDALPVVQPPISAFWYGDLDLFFNPRGIFDDNDFPPANGLQAQVTNFGAAPVPEPSAWVMFTLGIVVVGCSRRRRLKA
jgi:hypothetical protein